MVVEIYSDDSAWDTDSNEIYEPISVRAWREVIIAKRDAELGRWRDPEDILAHLTVEGPDELDKFYMNTGLMIAARIARGEDV